MQNQTIHNLFDAFDSKYLIQRALEELMQNKHIEYPTAQSEIEALENTTNLLIMAILKKKEENGPVQTKTKNRSRGKNTE